MALQSFINRNDDFRSNFISLQDYLPYSRQKGKNAKNISFFGRRGVVVVGGGWLGKGGLLNAGCFR